MGDTRRRTLMRHFVRTPAVTALALGMAKAAPAAVLITPSGGFQGGAPGLLRATRTTVDMTPVTTAANEHLGTATGTGEQTGGVLHRRLRPMRTGLKTQRGRYLLSGRAMHVSGGAVPGRLAGQGRCRTCLNGSDHLHQYLPVRHPPTGTFGRLATTLSLGSVFTSLNGDRLRYSPTMRRSRPPTTPSPHSVRLRTSVTTL